MEATAIMAIALGNGGGKPSECKDFVGIVCLLLINSIISFVEENNVGDAITAFMAGLTPKTKTARTFKEDYKKTVAVLSSLDLVGSNPPEFRRYKLNVDASFDAQQCVAK
ncbi:hypothetical protein PTKIN_Ptkin15bG0065300 [Pterospermum kingtungense]